MRFANVELLTYRHVHDIRDDAERARIWVARALRGNAFRSARPRGSGGVRDPVAVELEQAVSHYH